MNVEKINAASSTTSDVSCSVASSEVANASGIYTATCYDADGNLKWTDTYTNLVTTAGKNDLLDKYIAGSGYTAAWYLGLVDGGSSPTYAVADTMSSHAGWTENTGYTEANRVTPSWNAAAAGSKASNATSFSINATSTISGTFLVSDNTKSGTAGILYSAGNFTGGDKSVASGDTLNVTYTASV